MADVDGVAVTSKSAASGFAFDKTKPLSVNLRRFFTPAKGTGRERRFHVFCSVEGFMLRMFMKVATVFMNAATAEQSCKALRLRLSGTPPRGAVYPTGV